MSKLVNLLTHTFALAIFCLSHNAIAEILPHGSQQKLNTSERHIFMISPLDNATQSSIINKLAENLSLKYPDIIISKVAPDERIVAVNNITDIIVAIGPDGMLSAEKNYPETNKLYISTDPEKFRLNENAKTNDAILYMTQSYCRQLQFIKSIDNNWKVIGLLSSREKPINSSKIQSCADKFGLGIFSVKDTSEENITVNIKNALSKSDVLLALPDRRIYNSKTVKNILLTSYRYRKPVIGFSLNFVNAGALASIYSNTDQIAQSAADLIDLYFKQNNQFEKTINYPQLYNIGINNQVSRALSISPPSVGEIKQILKNNGATTPGKTQ